MRDLLAQAEGRVMLVTHQVNISALTGRSTRSGEVLIARRGDDGIAVIGSVLIAPKEGRHDGAGGLTTRLP